VPDPRHFGIGREREGGRGKGKTKGVAEGDWKTDFEYLEDGSMALPIGVIHKFQPPSVLVRTVVSAYAIRLLQTLRRMLAELRVRFNSYSSGPRVGTRLTKSLTKRRKKARDLSLARSRLRQRSSQILSGSTLRTCSK
jgi:hypothetical protein